jgi:hypothetical protein
MTRLQRVSLLFSSRKNRLGGLGSGQFEVRHLILIVVRSHEIPLSSIIYIYLHPYLYIYTIWTRIHWLWPWCVLCLKSPSKKSPGPVHPEFFQDLAPAFHSDSAWDPRWVCLKMVYTPSYVLWIITKHYPAINSVCLRMLKYNQWIWG